VPIPWPRHLSHGVRRPVSPSAYRARQYCGPQCKRAGAKARTTDERNRRWEEGWQRAQARMRERRPSVVPPPWGHACAVCGEPVRKGHPLHWAMPKEDLPVVSSSGA
jgi:hypothetical protein